MIQILNKHKHEIPVDAIHIGRGNPLGNPFPIGKEGTRDEVISKFRTYVTEKLLKRDPVILEAFKNIKQDSRLVCFCNPSPCHGDVIKELWELLFKEGDLEENLRKLDSQCKDQITEDDYRKWLISELCSSDPNVTTDFLDRSLTCTLIPEQYRHLKTGSVIISLFEEIMEEGSYEKGLEKLRKDHWNRPRYNPSEDGVTHINIYSKGKTDLGRLLSNFATLWVSHPEHGNWPSIEAFYYWYGTGKTHDIFRELSPYEVKKYGKNLPKVPVDDFQDQIRLMILFKIQYYSNIREALKQTALPFTHYYTYGNGLDVKIIEKDADQWLVEWVTIVRDYLQQRITREDLDQYLPVSYRSLSKQ
jgi:hypothetical protein